MPIRFSYDTNGRVTRHTKVTDEVTGSGPTTVYGYEDGRTTVTEPSGRRTVYSYGNDSVVHTAETGSGGPSVVLGGTLKDAEGSEIPDGSPRQLTVEATDIGGISKIEVLVDDSDVGAEDHTCTGSPCTLAWEFDGSECAEGEHQVRVRATDSSGNATQRTFAVRVPRRPAAPHPADPQPSEQERVDKALQTRRELFLRSDEAYVRTLEGDGEATQAVADWGVPLTPAETADMERRIDIQEKADAIGTYVQATPARTDAWAGTWIDQSDAAMVYVAFTRDASEHEAELRRRFEYPEKLRVVTMARSAEELKALHNRVLTDDAALRAEGVDVISVATGHDERNVVEVGVANPSETQAAIVRRRYGDAAKLVQVGRPSLAANPYRVFPRISAGVNIFDSQSRGVCSSNFSARNGSRFYMLSAGHCSDRAGELYLQGNPQNFQRVGTVAKNSYRAGSPGSDHFADAMAVRSNRQRTSNRINGRRAGAIVTEVESARQEELDQVVVKSGARTGVTMGRLRDIDYSHTTAEDGVRLVHQRYAGLPSYFGDSGGPIFLRLSTTRARAAGVLSAICCKPEPYLFTIYSHATHEEKALGVRICTQRRCRSAGTR